MLTVFSWNIEGARCGASTLSSLLSLHTPALMFLALACLKPTYCHHLNGEDALLPDQRRAWGGTLAMWHSSLDPFVSILPTTSSSVLSLLLSVPGLTPSLHIGLYLPNSGKEAEFTLALTALDMVLQDIGESHPCTYGETAT